MSEPAALTLLSRQDCHLCEVAQRELDRLRVSYRVVDIDQDDALVERYNDVIPVVLYGETELARAPIDASALKRAVQALALDKVRR